MACEALVAYELLTAYDALVAKELLRAYELLIATELLSAYELLTAHDDVPIKVNPGVIVILPNIVPPASLRYLLSAAVSSSDGIKYHCPTAPEAYTYDKPFDADAGPVSPVTIQINPSDIDPVIVPDDDAISDDDRPVLVCDNGIDILPVVGSGVAPFTVLTEAVNWLLFTVIPNPTKGTAFVVATVNNCPVTVSIDTRLVCVVVPNPFRKVEPVTSKLPVISTPDASTFTTSLLFASLVPLPITNSDVAFPCLLNLPMANCPDPDAIV